MNRKKISRLIAGALATSVVLNSSPSAVESVNAITKDIYNEFSEGHGLEDDSDENSDDSDANENTTDNSGTNLPELSGVSIEQMQRDFEGFSNGNEVNLLSDGDDSSTKVTIGQGGANSSQDSASVTNNSNFIYLSDLDSDQWKQVGDAVTVKQGYTAKKVTIDVKDYKYVKLETKKNGYNWWDYSVYADLRLVEDGYNTDNEVDSVYTGFKTLKEYDQEISKRTVEDNYTNHKIQKMIKVKVCGLFQIIFLDGKVHTQDGMKIQELNIDYY